MAALPFLHGHGHGEQGVRLHCLDGLCPFPEDYGAGTGRASASGGGLCQRGEAVGSRRRLVLQFMEISGVGMAPMGNTGMETIGIFLFSQNTNQRVSLSGGNSCNISYLTGVESEIKITYQEPSRLISIL